MNKKVLFITNTLCQGGAEHCLVTTLNHIDKKKYDVTLFVVKPILDLYDQLPKDIRVVVGKETRCNYSISNIAILAFEKLFVNLRLDAYANRFHNINSERIYKRKRKRIANEYFKNEKFDVVVCNTLSTWSTEIACEIFGEKRYLVYHGSYDTHHSMLEKIIQHYDGVITVSEEVKDRFVEWYSLPEEKVRVIENLIEADKVKQAAEEEARCVRENDEEIIICSCGRFTSEKGFNLAIDAANILKEEGYEFKWYFIGDGENRISIEKKIEEYSLDSNIFITGMLRNPFPIISTSNIYVQPSYEESYGRTIKEAMILGKPIVSTDTVGGRLLLNHGELGILTSINAMDIAKGIKEYLSNDYKRFRNSNLYSENEYLAERILYEKLWDQVLSS